jgi:hypothetical protein
VGWDNPISSYGTNCVLEISHGMRWNDSLVTRDFLIFFTSNTVKAKTNTLHAVVNNAGINKSIYIDWILIELVYKHMGQGSAWDGMGRKKSSHGISFFWTIQ